MNAGVRGAVVLALCASAAACAPTPPPLPSDPSGNLTFAQILAEARAYGSSDEQIRVLEHAVEVGEVTYDEYNALLPNTFACFDDIGISYVRLADRELAPGFLVPDFAHTGIPGMPDEQARALADKCLFANSEYASMAYQTQPAVYEAQDSLMRERLPFVIGCLRERGVAIDDNAPLDEVEQTAFDFWMSLEEAGIGGGNECYSLLSP